MQEYEVIELENGIRVIHKENPYTKIAHVGIMLDIGSRDEHKEEQGIAHFWEHMAFKGTEKRKSYHIINRLESLGGELNAYTTKEKICFYSSLLSNHLDKAVDLLADITFHSTFPERQIERERMVILEEMAMYRDTPEDAIIDEFDELVFKGHALGSNILGTEQSLAQIKQDSFLQFVQRNMNTSKIVISSVGNYSIKKLEKLIRKHVDAVPFKNHTPKRQEFSSFSASVKQAHRPISQVHHLMGKPAYSLKHPDRIPFFLLSNLLGGPAMNSKLNMSLREKHGFVYGVEASFSTYVDTGLFSIGFATDPKHYKKSLSLIEKELRNLQAKPMTEAQLHKGKQQLKGQLAMSEENNSSMMMMMAKSLLDLGTVPSLDGIFKKIDEVTPKKLQELALETLNPEDFSSLAYLPE